MWSVEQLQAIVIDDLINALPVLGAVINWSKDQRTVLYKKLIEVMHGFFTEILITSSRQFC